MARGQAQAGHARAATRPASAERVQRSLLRPERRVRHGRLRSGLPRERGDHVEEAPRGRSGRRSSTRATTRTRLPARLKQDAAAAARRCADGAPPARTHRGGGARATAAGLRRAARAPGRARAAPPRPRAGAGAGARRPRRARLSLPGAASLRAHVSPGACDRGDRRRSREADADGAAASGRGRLGQDRRCALRASPRGRVGTRRAR